MESHSQPQDKSAIPTEAGPSAVREMDFFKKINKEPIKFYPEGHPMNDIEQLNEDLFGHLKTDIISVTKRRKILRRLERRKERVLKQQIPLIPTAEVSTAPKKGSLWDVRERTPKLLQKKDKRPIIGPKLKTVYTIKENKIVRLEPVENEQINDNEHSNTKNQLYKTVDIVVPMNDAEKNLLEGTKMSVDDIRSIERFKDYQPGVPSKVLYLKNIAPSVTQEQLSLLFNQFHLQNGGPVDIKLMSGRMRGQAFVSFQAEDVAVQALEEVNGTILSGKPLIVQFGRNSNRIQDDNR